MRPQALSNCLAPAQARLSCSPPLFRTRIQGPMPFKHQHDLDAWRSRPLQLRIREEAESRESYVQSADLRALSSSRVV
jgi:hypothetical protein